MTINKRAVRSVKKNISFYIISTILTVLISILIIAPLSTGHNMKKVINDFVAKYKTEDAEFVTYNPISEDDMKTLESDYDVVMEYSRYKDMKFSGGDVDGLTVRVFDMPEKLNLCNVRDGSMPESGEALLTQNFADLHGIKVGDEISLGKYSYKISAFATKADYIYMLEKQSGYVDKSKFAVMVVTHDDYEKISADETGYYSIKYNRDNEKEVREKLNDEYVIASYLAATTNTRISMPVNEGDEVSKIATMYAPVMFIIVLALIVMVLGRNIRNEQYLLGTFISLGFSREQIIGHYMRFGLIPGIVGSVLGTIASIPVTRAITYFYIAYDFEAIDYTVRYDTASILAALILPSFAYCLAIALQAAKLLRKSAVDLLRNTGRDSRAIRIMRNSHAKTQLKMRVRSVIGHPGRSVVTIIGVCVAAFCILAGFIMSDSLDSLMHDGLISSVKYEYLYRLKSLENGFPDKGEALFQNYYEIDGNMVQLSAQGIDEGSMYFPDKTDTGEKLDLDKYYLTSAAAETYGVNAGDELTFYNIADLKAIIIGIEILGIVLGVFILYLVINMIVSESGTNISVMKVLGFSRKEIVNRVLNVNHILVCIGFLIGIPAAYAFVKVGYSDTIENYGMLLAPVLTVKAIVLGFVLTWITYELSLFLQKRKISRIDMVEALKENNRNE